MILTAAFLFLFAHFAVFENAEISVSTFAGMIGVAGIRNGHRTQALFSQPRRITVGTDGSLYITDSYNNAVRRISPDGIVSTVAGGTESGQADGPPHRAMFHTPIGLSFDRHGNLYVADTNNNRIAKIYSTGYVTTVMSNRLTALGQDQATRFKLDKPHGIVVDANGIVYAADMKKNRILAIMPDRTMSVFAGTGREGADNGPRLQASFAWPSDIAFDSQGNMYVTELLNHMVRKISRDGTVSTLAGSGLSGYLDGLGDQARFRGPKGITVDPQDNLYVTDMMNHVVRKIDLRTGHVVTIAGTGRPGNDNGSGAHASFSCPEGITYHEGSLYVVDSFMHAIRRIKLDDDAVVRQPIRPKPIRYGQDECIICRDSKQRNQVFFHCSEQCGNSFHTYCIEPCRDEHGNIKCPLCRTQWVYDRVSVKPPGFRTKRNKKAPSIS